MLQLLLEHAGALVTRKEIQDAVWGEDTHVDFDSSLNTCIRQIRVALGDDPEAPRYVTTVPKVGYRFAVNVEDSTASPRRWTPARVLSASLLSVGAIAGLVLVDSSAVTPPATLRLDSPRRITSGPGIDDYPAWSPNGEMLAYNTDATGNYDIWIIHIDSGTATNLTGDSRYHDRFPNWSHDGSKIAFYSERDGGGYFVLSIDDRSIRRIAGLPTQVPVEFAGAPLWSPDDAEIAWLVVNYVMQDISIEIQSVDGNNSRRSRAPGRTQGRFDLAWSPNGRFFAYVDAHSLSSDVTSIWVRDVRDGTGHTVVERHRNDRRPSWSADSRQLYFVSEHDGSADLWRQPLDEEGSADGAPMALTAGVGIRRAAFSADSTRLAYSKARETANLWRLPVLADRPVGWEDAEQITFDQAVAEQPDLSPDGHEVAFATDRLGGPKIWILRLSDRRLRPFTAEADKSWGPRWSPDGREIVFCSYRSDNRDIWVKPVSGGPARQLTEHSGEDMNPVWSPDGTRIAFMSDRSGNWDIWVVPALGGEPAQITTDPAWESSPQWSPDGERLIFSSGRLDKTRLWQAPVAGGPIVPLGADSSAVNSVWPAGEQVYFIGRDENAGHIWELNVNNGSVRQTSSLENRAGALSDELFTVRGNQLVFSWKEDTSDLWLMDVSLVRYVTSSKFRSMHGPRGRAGARYR